MLEDYFGVKRRTQSYIDYAATHSELACMIGCTNPDKWVKYLEANHPTVKFKIVDGGILINPRKE